MKDGWHVVAGYKAYIEAGYIARIIKKDGQEGDGIYRYISKIGRSVMERKITPAQFRAGVNSGTITVK